VPRPFRGILSLLIAGYFLYLISYVVRGTSPIKVSGRQPARQLTFEEAHTLVEKESRISLSEKRAGMGGNLAKEPEERTAHGKRIKWHCTRTLRGHRRHLSFLT